MNESTSLTRLAWEPLAAAACFLTAVLAVVVGIVFTTGWLLNANVHPLLHGVGVVLLIIAIPILILGGHCMDLRDRKVHGSSSQQS
jgi:protein-S-isoprenylcysteine O-methyltransferase Ste14